MLPNPQVNVPLYLRSFYVSIVLYCAGLFAIKMTFLFQYYRVFGVQNLRKIFVAAILIVGAWSLSQLLIGIFICSPIRGFWDSTIRSTCIPNYPQFYINAAGNIATDVAVLVMPFPLLGRLNLPGRQRMLLFGIFGLGFFTVAISVLRIKYLKLFEDFTWENVESSAWSVGELCSGITCACLPTLRPFLKAHFPSLGTRLTGGGYQEYGNDVEVTAAAAGGATGATARHKRIGSGRSSQPSVTAPNSGGDGGARGPNARGRSHIESGESTEDIIGLEATRQDTAQSRGTTDEEGASSGEERDAHLGLRMTVLSRVDAGGRPEEVARPRPTQQVGGIQVQRAVHQVEQRRRF